MLAILLPILFYTHVANITCLYNVSDIGGLLGCDNTATNGYLGMVVLLAILIVGTFGLVAMGVDLEIAGLSVSIICTLLCVIMIALAIVNPLYILLFVSVDVLCFAATMLKNSTQPYR
jgi:hypothetical protein